MDANTTLSPLTSAPSFSASPSSGSRKRSIHEVDDVAMPSPNAKRPSTDYVGENQENRDPSVPSQPDDTASSPVDFKHTLPPPPTVEIVMRQTQNTQNTESAGAADAGSPSVNTASNPEPDTPASKKRKLASTKKDSKQQEKEAKERQKAEEKVKKEEERLKKEEEKAKREEEKRLKAEEKKKREAEREEEKRKKEAQREEERKQRDEKKKAKEDEKAAKEEEKRKKDEEKEKKTRSQMKLNSFFAKPPVSSTPSGQATVAPSPRKLSTTADPLDKIRDSQSDYKREFPTFFLQSHTTVAPPHRFERDSEALEHVRQAIDACLSNENSIEIHPFRPSEVFQIIPFHRRGQSTASVKDILLQLQKSEDPAEPTQSLGTTPSSSPQDLLRKVTLKSLKFGEDIRPPYQGTYTRYVPESSVRRLARNPYHRGLPDTNYDYDSEAEWEEPEEGEELDSEEEDEGSDEGEDDLDGFLDDEDDALAEGKRRLIVGDLEPDSTGMNWAADGVEPEMQVYKIETISDAVKFPIDPFSTAYWEKPKPVEREPAKARPATKMDGFLVPAVPGAPAAGTALPPTSKAKRPFPPDQIGEFREAIEGSDLSKIGLVEILKKRFPKVSKETLKATLDQVAVRVGQKEIDKKWVCR